MINLLSTLRQWCYPKEFRIGPPIWSPEMLLALQQSTHNLSGSGSVVPSLDETAYFRLLADVATGLWRLRQKMLRPGTDQPFEEMRRAYRSFESIWDTLTQAGVEILDHTDLPFASGLSLTVLAFQPMPGLRREQIIETLRPTIYYKQKMLQMGEVIVGTPETPAPSMVPETWEKDTSQAPEDLYETERGGSHDE